MQGQNWNAHHLDNHIEEAMRLTRAVSDSLAAIKGNVSRIEEALRRLLKTPMFERKEGKVRSCQLRLRWSLRLGTVSAAYWTAWYLPHPVLSTASSSEHVTVACKW